MRQRFQRRTRILEQIRSQIYLSGYLCPRLPPGARGVNLHSAPELILYAVRKGIIL